MPFFKKEEENQQAATIEDLSQKIRLSQMPPDVEKISVQELDMLSKISPESSEFTIGLTYIDYLTNMPWNISTEDNLDISRAERILNEEHYGLQKTKERIIEHLAVKVLVLKRKPQILVIDDEEIARKNLTHILEKENYDVMAVQSGIKVPIYPGDHNHWLRYRILRSRGHAKRSLLLYCQAVQTGRSPSESTGGI
jgi:ATP-dependent Lon protease